MKKIVVLGRSCEETQDIYFCLNKCFEVKLCAIDYDVFQGVKKIFKPDLMVICFAKYTVPDKRFFELLSESRLRIPVITVGLESVDFIFEKINSGMGFVNIIKRDIKRRVLEQACTMLGVSGDEGTSGRKDGRRGDKPLVLVVDDFALLLRQLRGMLQEKYDVAVATSGVQAMSAVGRRRPDLILLDYAMPKYDGKKIFEVLKMSEETREIPVIFLTGVSEHSKVEEIIDLKPAGYLLKPPDKNKLLAMIESVLSEREMVSMQQKTGTGSAEKNMEAAAPDENGNYTEKLISRLKEDNPDSGEDDDGGDDGEDTGEGYDYFKF